MRAAGLFVCLFPSDVNCFLNVVFLVQFSENCLTTWMCFRVDVFCDTNENVFVLMCQHNCAFANFVIASINSRRFMCNIFKCLNCCIFLHNYVTNRKEVISVVLLQFS